MRACVIFNPVARGEKARRFRAHLAEIGRAATLLETTAAGDATRLATEAAAQGFDTIVAAGGDGTLNEVVNGLADAPGGLARARLGVLPLGTVNVFARELSLPREPIAAWQVVTAGQERKVDLPRAEWSSAGQVRRRWFCQLAGAGLDARAVELVNWQAKKRLGPLAYVLSGLHALCERPAALRATGAGQVLAGQLVLVGNGRLYGGTYGLFPEAELADGRLQVCVFPRAGWLSLFLAGPVLLLRGRVPERLVRRFAAPEVEVTCAGRSPFEVDGELAGEVPVKFLLQPQALRVLVP